MSSTAVESLVICMSTPVLLISDDVVCSCVGTLEVLDTSVEGFDEELSFSITVLYVTPVSVVVALVVTPGSLVSSCVTVVVVVPSVEK